MLALMAPLFVGCGPGDKPDSSAPPVAVSQPLPTAAPDLAAGPKTLGDVVTPTQAATAPPDGQYYMAIRVADSSGIPMPADKCVSQGFWAFLRKAAGLKSSAAIIVTATITPKGSAASTTVPIYSVSAAEISADNKGSQCDAQFTNRDVTFRYPSTLNPNFTVDITYNYNDQVNSAVVQNTLATATSLMSLIGSASGSPAVIVAKLGDPTVAKLSAGLDADLANNWTHVNGLTYQGSLNSGADGSARADEIDIAVPHIQATQGGVQIAADWNASAKLYLAYYPELFKSGGAWTAPASIDQNPIVSGLPSGQTNLEKLILNGDVTSGFDWKSLAAATNVPSLQTACTHLDDFLAGFLIDDDRLAAKFAVLRTSPYADDPTLRAGSNCFTDGQLKTLSSMNADYVFADATKTQRAPSAAQEKMDPIRVAIASGNASLIKTILVTDTTKFFLSLGPNTADFYSSDPAIAKFGTLRLSCYQAGQRDLGVIGGVLTDGATKEAALFTFDSGGLLSHVVVMSPTDAANALGVLPTTWLDPSTMACAKSN